MELVNLLGVRAVLILRVKFSKKEYMKYISHLDLLRLFERTFRLVNLPLEYSQGYHPRPRFSFASPLALGMEGHGEYMEVHLVEKIDIDFFISSMNRELPEDIRVLACEYSQDSKAVGHYIHWADYSMNFELEEAMNRKEVQALLDKFLNQDEVLIEKEKKKKNRIIKWKENIIPLISVLELIICEETRVELRARLKTGLGNLRPEDLMEALERELSLGILADGRRINRLELLGETNGQIHSIFKGEGK